MLTPVEVSRYYIAFITNVPTLYPKFDYNMADGKKVLAKCDLIPTLLQKRREKVPLYGRGI
jgi:hypothetical protein